jgi:hypothetical protein
MPWPQKQFRAIMANTDDPKKRALYASEQKTDKDKLIRGVLNFAKRKV